MLDLTNPGVQVALIAAAATVATALLTFLAALVNFWAGVVYRRHDAQLKRSEQREARCSNNAEALLLKLSEFQAAVSEYVARVEDAEEGLHFIRSVLESKEAGPERERMAKKLEENGAPITKLGTREHELIETLGMQVDNWLAVEGPHLSLWFTEASQSRLILAGLRDSYCQLCEQLSESAQIATTIEKGLSPLSFNDDLLS